MKEFWLDLAKRTLKTVCETAVGVIGASAMISDVNWIVVASSAGLSAIMTILINLPNIPLGEK